MQLQLLEQESQNVAFRTHIVPVQSMTIVPPANVKSGTLPGSRNVLRRSQVILDDQQFETTGRFWGSLCARFGISPSIFNFFDHEEVFDRIAQKKDVSVRVVSERVTVPHPTEAGKTVLRQRVLGLTSPGAAMIGYPDLRTILKAKDAMKAEYKDGEVYSSHKLPMDIGTLNISGEQYLPRITIRTPIDGYGLPSIFLEMLRRVCSNGMVAFSPAFRTDVQLGKNDEGNVAGALVRMLDTYSNDEGFAAFRERIEKAGRSWASIHEARTLSSILRRVCPATPDDLRTADRDVSDYRYKDNVKVHDSFWDKVGNLVELYGLAQLDALGNRKARTLPTRATVNDLINFSTEVATHHVKDSHARFALQAWMGTMLCQEFDLEGSKDQIKDFDAWLIEKPKATAPAKAAPAKK